MAQTNKSYTLFISYADSDQDWVKGYLLDALQAAGVVVHTEAAFTLGAPRLLEFEHAIQHSARTLLVLSPAYLAEHLQQFVDLLAQSYGLETGTWPVIPLLLHPVTLPPRLAMLQALDATNPDEWPTVVTRLSAALGAPVPESPPLPACPYPGMMPFREGQSALFFGRTVEITECVERLRLHPLLAIIGPSGCGKSSLVFAGILPALRASPYFAHKAWTLKNIRPGTTPFAMLNHIMDGAQEGENPTLLIVDQLEEVFTLAAKEEAAAFFQALLGYSRSPHVYTLLTMRADFYADLMMTTFWLHVQDHRLEVTPLDEHRLREAVTGPAEQVGVFIEAGLVERLVADAASEPGVLPLVQETLVLLWGKVERRFLPLRAYEALVLPRSAYGGAEHTGLQVAMARRADAAFYALGAEQTTTTSQTATALRLAQQTIARRIFLRLIQFGEGRADTRRQQTVAQLQTAIEDTGLFEATLQHFVNCRLLTLDRQAQDQTRLVDIAHEALISGWPMLEDWLKERRSAEQTRRRLEAKCTEWQRLGQAEGGLLDLLELLEAENWLTSPDGQELGTSAELLALIKRSRAAIDAAETAKTTAQQQKLAQERKLARRLRWVVALVTLLLVVAAVSAYLIGQQNQNNRKISRITRAELLHDKGNQLPVSLLLAIESIDSSAAYEAEELLRSGLALLPKPNQPIQHAADVNDVAFSPDGKWLASVGDDGVLRLSAIEIGQIVKTLAYTPTRVTPIYAVAFSPDSRFIATGGEDRTAYVWDVASGQSISPPLRHTDRVMSLLFSPDGQHLATAGREHNVRVWDYLHSTTIFTLTHAASVNSLAFSPDGQWLATASEDGTAKLWNVTTGQLLFHVAHAGQVLQVVFSTDGRRLATAGSDNKACVWDVTTGVAIGCVNNDDWVEDVAFSPDGQLMVTVSDDNSARLWDLRTFRERLRVYHLHAINRVAFHPQGLWFVTAGQDGTARVWDTASGTEMARMIHGDAIENAVFSPDGHLVATASGDHQARLWNVDLTAEVARFQQAGYLWSVAFSPDSQGLAAATDGTALATIWEIADQKTVTILPKGIANVGIAAAFSQDLCYLAMPSRDESIRIWDLTKQREIAQFPHTVSAFTGPQSLALSSDGRWLAHGGDTGLHVWDVAKQQEVLSIHDQKSVDAVAFSPSGQWLASAIEDGSVQIYSHLPNPAIITLTGEISVTVMSFSADETKLATAVAGPFRRFVRIWDVATQKESAPLMEHTDDVISLAFSPDGQWLATGSVDGVARIWEVATGQEVTRIQHRGQVQTVAFSPDGHWLVTASGHVAKVWDFQKLEKVTAEALTTKVCSRLTRNLELGEWGTYFRPDPYHQTCTNLPDLSNE